MRRLHKVQLFNVAPSLPQELEFLETLSYNMWWSWNPDAIELFRRIDPAIWKDAGHNPFRFFNQVSQKRLEALVDDDGFMSHYQQVMERFEAEVLHLPNGKPATARPDSVAYFSMEYGIHESVRLYSGGLGCLAGDHLKSASDLGVPLVAVGLLYRCGYFQQYLSQDGWQQEGCRENEMHLLPLKPACDGNNNQVHVDLPLPGGQHLKAAVWRLDVGRVPIFLLDSNLLENPPDLRNICASLYDADRQTRLRQELLLGIGGFRALLALGFDPPVCHMNEGHAAFVGLARVAHLVESGKADRDTAIEIVRRTGVFTTHTPVPAGNETFAGDLVTAHLTVLEKELGFKAGDVLAWGRAPGAAKESEVTMTILALHFACHANGVSKLHGKVSRKMWSHLWPDRPEDEIPIAHITNGVHIASWISPDCAVLFDRYLGPEWRDNPSDKKLLARVAQIPDEELWRAREVCRSRLIRVARELGEKQLAVRNAPHGEVAQIKSVLHHDTLTVGFARRFATYKRATLIFSDHDRIEALLTNKERPIQIVLAGKAHPADDTGKDIIRQIIQFARSKPALRQHIIFLEDYDIRIARYLVQGVDLWLNTPRRPQEASGTSGMKAAVNGGLNLSILDGWWDEGYSPACGWAIGAGEEFDNQAYQDALESQALYNLLENEVVPCFYNRPSRDFSVEWLKKTKASMAMALSYFTSHRMVAEYDKLLYGEARKEHEKLRADNAAHARSLVEQQKRLRDSWSGVSLGEPVPDRDISLLHVGDKFNVTVNVELGEVRPDEVDVEVYFGPVDAKHIITESRHQNMAIAEDKGKGAYVYRQEVVCEITGRYGLTARIMPHDGNWKGAIPGLIAWANHG